MNSIKKRSLGAPPIVRPKPASKTVQPKMASFAVNKRPPVAPPVYRPELKKIVQPKAFRPPRMSPILHPLKHQTRQAHQFKPAVAQAKNPVGVPNARRSIAPSVYRPNATPRVAQAKMAVPKPFAVARAGSGRVVQLAEKEEEASKMVKKAKLYQEGFKELGHVEDKMAPGGMATFGHLGIVIEDGDEEEIEITLGAAKNLSRKGEHAEDVMIRILRENSGMFAPGKVNPILMDVTKSPCSSEHKTSKKPIGCTEELIKLVKVGTLLAGKMVKFKLTLVVHHLYGGSGDRRRASCEALKDLKKAGATVILIDNKIVGDEECVL